MFTLRVTMMSIVSTYHFFPARKRLHRSSDTGQQQASQHDTPTRRMQSGCSVMQLCSGFKVPHCIHRLQRLVSQH